MQPLVISRDPTVVGGTTVLRGTRVPVQTLLVHLVAGNTTDEFPDGFPSVTRDQVIAFLEQSKNRLIETVA